MGFEKAIEHGKTKRKAYKGSKAFDCSCRNHGTCEWCRENRMYKTIRDLAKTDVELKNIEY